MFKALITCDMCGKTVRLVFDGVSWRTPDLHKFVPGRVEAWTQQQTTEGKLLDVCPDCAKEKT